MKKLFVWLCFFGVSLGCGCAGTQARPDALQITITPEQIYPGCVVSVQVIAPAGTREVTGRLDLLGSPVISLKTKDSGKTWIFITQIPLAAVWQPGKHRVQVQGIARDGSELRGETWIIAP
ncbi:hypothetical protein KAR34_05925 [bacterium]|nr:hypothetical protein [bacterium]